MINAIEISNEWMKRVPKIKGSQLYSKSFKVSFASKNLTYRALFINQKVSFQRIFLCDLQHFWRTSYGPCCTPLPDRFGVGVQVPVHWQELRVPEWPDRSWWLVSNSPRLWSAGTPDPSHRCWGGRSWCETVSWVAWRDIRRGS